MLTTDLRGVDTAYRYGDEELCALTPESTAELAAKVAECVRQRVGTSFGWATTAPVSISAGVAQLARRRQRINATLCARGGYVG